MASFSSRRPIIYGIPGSSDLRKTYTASVANFLGLQNTKSQVEMDARVCSDALNVYVDSDYRLCTRKRLANKLRQTTEFSVIEAVNIGETVYAIIQKKDNASFFLSQIYPKYEQYSDRLTQSSKLFVVNQKLYVTGVSVENEERDRFGLFFLKDNQLVSIVDSAYIPNFTLDSNRKYSSGDSANIFSSKFKLGDNTSFTPEDIASKIPRDLRGNTQNYATFEATGYNDDDQKTTYRRIGDNWRVWKGSFSLGALTVSMYDTNDPLSLGSPIASIDISGFSFSSGPYIFLKTVDDNSVYYTGSDALYRVDFDVSSKKLSDSKILDLGALFNPVYITDDGQYILIKSITGKVVIYNHRYLDTFKNITLLPGTATRITTPNTKPRIQFPFVYVIPSSESVYPGTYVLTNLSGDWLAEEFRMPINTALTDIVDSDTKRSNYYISSVIYEPQSQKYMLMTSSVDKVTSGIPNNEFIWQCSSSPAFVSGPLNGVKFDSSVTTSLFANLTGQCKNAFYESYIAVTDDAVIATIDNDSVFIKNNAVNAIFSCSIPLAQLESIIPGKSETKDSMFETVYRNVKIRVLAIFDADQKYSFDDSEDMSSSIGQIYYDWVKAREKIGKIDGVYTMNNFIIFTCGNHFVYSSSFDSTFAPVDNVNSLRDNDSSIVDILVISPTAALLFTKETTYWLLGSGEGDLTYCNPVVSQFTLNDVTRFASVKLALRDTPCVMARDGIMAFSDSSEVTETAKNITNMSEPVIDKYLNMIRTPGERMAFRGIWFNVFANVTSRESYMLFYDARTSSWWYWHMPISIRHMFMHADEFYVVDGSGNVYYLTDKSKLDDRNLLRTYNDEIPSGDAKIFWFIRSHPMSLGAVTRGKQIKKVILSLVPDTLVGEITPDDPNYDDVGSLNSSSVTGREIRNFEIRVNLIPYASVDLISRRGMISDVVRQLDISELRMFVPKFNYVSYDLASSTSPLKYDKLTLSSISFLYQILDKLS